MIADREVSGKAAELDALAMRYETAVIALPAERYAEAFCRFYSLSGRELKLVPFADGFHHALQQVSGDDVWQPIAAQTERLFGLPNRVTVPKNDRERKRIIRGLEGPNGLGPFFFAFDLMFCEYDGFTLCFLSGSNN